MSYIAINFLSLLCREWKFSSLCLPDIFLFWALNRNFRWKSLEGMGEESLFESGSNSLTFHRIVWYKSPSWTFILVSSALTIDRVMGHRIFSTFTICKENILCVLHLQKSLVRIWINFTGMFSTKTSCAPSFLFQVL